MPRKQMIEGGTRNRIVQVGSQLFFEKGFDGTGIRALMKEVGADVGTFYYYFKSKDELFDEVLERFFEPYEQSFAALAEEAKTQPYQALYRFFQYVKKEVRTFRAKYADHMHRTVRWAIREHTLTILEPYLEQIITTLIHYGATPCLDAHTMAIFLAHGLGSCILHEDADWVEMMSDDMRKAVNLIMGLDPETSRRMFEVHPVDLPPLPRND